MAIYRYKSSQEYAAESLEADSGDWITYIVNSQDEQLPFDEWLQQNMPSTRTRYTFYRRFSLHINAWFTRHFRKKPKVFTSICSVPKFDIL